jgi:hypothetical protein
MKPKERKDTLTVCESILVLSISSDLQVVQWQCMLLLVQLQ